MSTTENREAAFMGKITAAATHEIRNVLAIIQESGGLIEDMVRLFEESGKLKFDRVLRSVERIGLQVNRGADLMTALNRVAHGLDRDRDRVDLHNEATYVALLCGRLAKQKGHELQVTKTDDDVMVTVNRLHLEMALFSGLECCIEQLPEAGKIIMHIGLTGNTPSVVFLVECANVTDMPSPTEAIAWAEVVESIDRLGATVTESGPGRFEFGFPSADGG
jgi:hypothetical protein